MVECPDCHGEYKNLGVHKRYCKSNKSQSSDPAGTFLNQEVSSKPIVSTSTPADENHKVIQSNTKEKEPKKKLNIVINLYMGIFFLYIIISVAQWLLLGYFKVYWLFYIPIYIIDIISLVGIWVWIWSSRKKQEPVIFETMEDFIKQVPKWATTDKAPNSGIIGSILHGGKEYKQLVLVSETFEPKVLWVEWDGFLFRTKDRAYRPPRDVRGNQFFYHIDKKTPLIDTAAATQEDAEESYHENAIANQYFALGHATALAEAQKMIQTMFIIVICILGGLVLFAFYSYGQFNGVHNEIGALNNLAVNMSLRIP